jgi:ATP-dependent Lon protease
MGTKNGILFFDEFDKASDRKEIMSTLLHVTDFSQNNEFRDNYFPELCQDLGKIWFIYSMNELPKDPAMLDRLEIIKVDGYNFQEKKSIAKEYLFPKFSKELMIENDFKVDEEALHALIKMDNSEGVRHLERSINLLMEKIYFFLYNRGMNYDYNWFKQMKDSFSNGVLRVTEDLINKIVTKQELESFNSMYN